MRRFAMTAAALALAAAGLAAAPQAASAAPAGAYGCPGSQIDSYANVYGGVTYGHTLLYYSSANGGTNCAVYVTSHNVGKVRYMGVDIQRGTKTNGGIAPLPQDYGNYSQYAGPVSVTNADGYCVLLSWIDYNATGGSGWVHCK